MLPEGASPQIPPCPLCHLPGLDAPSGMIVCSDCYLRLERADWEHLSTIVSDHAQIAGAIASANLVVERITPQVEQLIAKCERLSTIVIAAQSYYLAVQKCDGIQGAEAELFAALEAYR